MSADQAEQDRADLARVRAELRHRWPESRLDPTLDRIRALVDVLGDPQRSYPVIHVAGTNGKTTTARIIDAILRGFGLRVGRFTSPDLVSPTERISLDGEPISDRRFVDTYEDIQPYLELVDKDQPVPLSYFEVLTAMGFAAFADAPVDVAVVEVGMGGAWDSTNVADGAGRGGHAGRARPHEIPRRHDRRDRRREGRDHQAGVDRGARGAAAGGGRGAAAAGGRGRRDRGPGGQRVRRARPRAVAVGGQVLTVQGLAGVYDELFLPLHGAHQAQNAAVALAAVEAFLGAGADTGVIDVEVVREALRRRQLARPARGGPGRADRASSTPRTTRTGWRRASPRWRSRSRSGGWSAWSRCSADKDVTGMLEQLEPVLDEIVVTENSSPRRMSADDLAALAVPVFGADRVVVEPRLDDAIEAAVQLAEEGEDQLGGAGVLVTGSVSHRRRGAHPPRRRPQIPMTTPHPPTSRPRRRTTSPAAADGGAEQRAGRGQARPGWGPRRRGGAAGGGAAAGAGGQRDARGRA